MAQRINRVRNLLTANATVTTAVPATSMATNHFPARDPADPTKPFVWPQPGVLISTNGSPIDEQIENQRLTFGVRCYDETDVEAEALYQIIRTALTGKPEFGALVSDTAIRALWLAQGIERIWEEVGGQRVPEPEGTPRGGEYVLASFTAIFPDT